MEKNLKDHRGHALGNNSMYKIGFSDDTAKHFKELALDLLYPNKCNTSHPINQTSRW